MIKDNKNDFLRVPLVIFWFLNIFEYGKVVEKISLDTKEHIRTVAMEKVFNSTNLFRIFESLTWKLYEKSRTNPIITY